MMIIIIEKKKSAKKIFSPLIMKICNGQIKGNFHDHYLLTSGQDSLIIKHTAQKMISFIIGFMWGEVGQVNQMERRSINFL